VPRGTRSSRGRRSTGSSALAGEPPTERLDPVPVADDRHGRAPVGDLDRRLDRQADRPRRREVRGPAADHPERADLAAARDHRLAGDALVVAERVLDPVPVGAGDADGRDRPRVLARLGRLVAEGFRRAVAVDRDGLVDPERRRRDAPRDVAEPRPGREV